METWNKCAPALKGRLVTEIFTLFCAEIFTISSSLILHYWPIFTCGKSRKGNGENLTVLCLVSHPGYFGKVGMRHYHLKRNTTHCPTINLDKLWTLVSEQTRVNYGKKPDGPAPIINAVRAVSTRLRCKWSKLKSKWSFLCARSFNEAAVMLVTHQSPFKLLSGLTLNFSVRPFSTPITREIPLEWWNI